MAQKDRATLQAEANVIKNETATGANTAQRVGGMDLDNVDSMLNIIDDTALYDQTPQTDALEETAPILTTFDTYVMPTTPDGHNFDMGQEMFFPAVNETTTDVTELTPKVFLLGQAHIADPKYLDAILPLSADLQMSSLFGVNTTEALAGGNTKVVVMGRIEGVDTSAWVVNTVLYVSPDVAGDMTDIRPAINAYAVARVELSDAVNGILLVKALGGTKEDLLSISAGASRLWFSGDETTLPAGTFYDAIPNARGIVGSVNQTVTINDNETAPYLEDLIGNPFTVTGHVKRGEFGGILTWAVNTSNGLTQFTVEFYLADTDGNVIDSSSGLPNGSYPFSPIMVAESPILDNVNSLTQYADFVGFVLVDQEIPVDHRIRIRVLASKPSTQGVAQDVEIFYGADQFSFVDYPASLSFGDLSDVEDTREPFTIMQLGNDGIWRNQSGNITEQNNLDDMADVQTYSGLAVDDALYWDGSGFWMNKAFLGYKFADYIDSFTGNPSEPILTNLNGMIDSSLVDISSITIQGDFTPTGGDEYPDNTAAPDGSVWIVVDVGVGGYLFVGGDLAGQTAFPSSWMVWYATGWVLANNESDPAIPVSAGLVEDTSFPNNTARFYNDLTQAEYDSIGTKDNETLYFITAT
jgi:hypothetical protein